MAHLPPSGHVMPRHVSLPPDPRSVGGARAFVERTLVAMALPDLVEHALLAVSELVTNAVLHAKTDIRVEVDRADEGVRVDVYDASARLPTLREYGGYATTGRGLTLVAALVDDLGVEAVPAGGKRVWFVLRPGQTPSQQSAWPTWNIDELLDEIDRDEAQASRARLQRLPTLLWAAAQQHHDALLRELLLYRAEHPAAPGQADFETAQQAESIIAAAVEQALHKTLAQDTPMRRLPRGHPSPLAPSPEALDVTIAADQHMPFAALQDVLDEAEALASSGHLLARPALPEIVAVRDWCCEQVIAQLNGVPPSPWAGADREVFTRDDSHRFQTAAPDWDDAMVRESDRCVLAADDNNRLLAVSRPIAEALGWTVDELVGRRVVALVPPRYREAHVAGFTRHLTTGEAHALGVPLDLPVLHKSGHEIMFSFLIERAATTPGRAVYVAWLTVRESDGRSSS